MTTGPGRTGPPVAVDATGAAFLFLLFLALVAVATGLAAATAGAVGLAIATAVATGLAIGSDRRPKPEETLISSSGQRRLAGAAASPLASHSLSCRARPARKRWTERVPRAAVPRAAHITWATPMGWPSSVYSCR